MISSYYISLKLELCEMIVLTLHKWNVAIDQAIPTLSKSALYVSPSAGRILNKLNHIDVIKFKTQS